MNDLLFSICIPVRDDLKNLRQCLAGFKNQNLSGCEIIVCDDGSAPPLSADDLRGLGVDFTVIKQQGNGPSAARNHLARIASGKYLFFVDADTIPRFNLIGCARRVISEHPQIEVFYGSYDDEPAHGTLVSSYKNLFHHYTHQQSARVNEEVRTFWCGCGVILRDLYLECGGLSEFYDKPSIEDIELGTRLSARGFHVQIFPQLQVKHLKKWTLRSWLYTDLFRRGIPWVRLMRATRDWASQLNFSWSQRTASLAAVTFVLSIPMTVIYSEFAFLGSLALGIFLLANLDFIDLVRRKRGLMASIAIVPLHVIYALICVASIGAAFFYPPLKLPPTQKLQPLSRR